MNSIIQEAHECLVCRTTLNLHNHHIFFGHGNRKISDQNGFTCYLCARHHNMSNAGVHLNRHLDLKIKQMCQRKYEETHTREEFIRLIGKSYIDIELPKK